jgi:hypothetical protein
MVNCWGDCRPGEREGEGVSGFGKGMRPPVGERTRLGRVRMFCVC